MLNLRFLQRWSWKVLYSGLSRRVVCWQSTDVSVEHIASTFRVKEKAKQETSVNQILLHASCWIFPRFIYLPWMYMRHVTLKHRLTFGGTIRRYIPEYRTLYWLRVSGNIVLRKTFGPGRREVTEGWRQLHKEEPNIIRMIQSRTGWARHTVRIRKEKYVHRFLVLIPAEMRPLLKHRLWWEVKDKVVLVLN
jgi:hypothetical protein